MSLQFRVPRFLCCRRQFTFIKIIIIDGGSFIKTDFGYLIVVQSDKRDQDLKCNNEESYLSVRCNLLLSLDTRVTDIR